MNMSRLWAGVLLRTAAAALMLCLWGRGVGGGNDAAIEANCRSLAQEIDAHDQNVFRPAMAKFALHAADELEKYPKGSRKAKQIQQQLLKEASSLGRARQKFLRDKLWGPDCSCTGPRLAELQSRASKESDQLQTSIDGAGLE
jgi:hypothetical protein